MHVVAQEECQRADQKMPKENGWKRFKIMSKPAVALRKMFRHKGDGSILNQDHTKRSPSQSKEERKGRNGMSNNCRSQDTGEEGYQEEPQKRKEWKKEKKVKEANKAGRRKTRELKK